VEDLRRDAVPAARRVVARTTGMVVRPGERVVVDNGASLVLVLPELGNNDDGLELTIVKKLATGVITLTASRSTINGAASTTIAAAGVTRVLADAGSYWV
jgi:DeoR/GlpR family transcriptional regulator of sugar metabolism